MHTVGHTGDWARGRARLAGDWRYWRVLGWGLAALTLVWWATHLAAELYTDWLWFSHLGHANVFLVGLATRGALFLFAGGIALTSLWGNPSHAARLRQQHERAGAEEEALWEFVARVSARLVERTAWARRAQMVLRAAALVCTLLFASAAAGQWDMVLRALHPVAFGTADPLFGRDPAVYVFTLPLLRAVDAWLLWLAVATFALTAAMYLVLLSDDLRLRLYRRSDLLAALGALGRHARVHLAGIGAVFFLVVAVRYQIDIVDLVFSTSGRAAGVGFPGFTDVQVQAPAYGLMSGAAVLAAILVLAGAWRRYASLVGWSVAAYVAVATLGLAVPMLIQVVIVAPDELEREQDYLTRFIASTRHAYAVDAVQEQFLPAEGKVLPDDPTALANVPLWSQVALRGNLNQLQAFRPYYTFVDADPDRYVVDGQQRLVMVSVRELNYDALPARSWLNTHLQFTHGFGVVMAAAGGVGPDGSPEWLLQDVPPRGALAVDRPQIYFGERTTEYVVVKTNEQEIDYPRGDDAATTRYAGSGIPIGSPLVRAAFAYRFGDPSLLFSTAIRGESEILFQREVIPRVRALAPFLVPDPDPYPVVVEDRVFWIVDAYTITADYPVSHRTDLGDGAAANYIRNSVKAIVDAYDGSARFFASDPDDPLLRSYEATYPGLVEPMSAMPEPVRAHVRYPRGLFEVQANVLARFHAEDATAFYYGGDTWRPAEEKFESRVDSGPYYTLVKLPGSDRQELLLLQPFSPFDPSNDRHNLVALVAARSDPPNAGMLMLQRYPRDRLVAGPLQVERRIDQDPEIAAQFGVWQRAGSLVVRSKLVALPLGSTPLYVEGVYLQRGVRPAMPQLQRVVVSTGDQVVMAPTLESAIQRLAEGTGTPPPEPPDQPAATVKRP